MNAPLSYHFLCLVQVKAKKKEHYVILMLVLQELDLLHVFIKV